MGKTHTIITDKGHKIRRQVLNQNGTLYTSYNGKIWLVELAHTYPFMDGSKVVIKVYKMIRQAVLN